jgi:hypothetical protein
VSLTPLCALPRNLAAAPSRREPSRSEGHVAEHAPGSGFVINFLPRFGHLLVGEEPSCSMSDGAEEISEILVSPSRNISFYVVIELQVLDCLLSFRQLMVPAGLTDRIAHVN